MADPKVVFVKTWPTALATATSGKQTVTDGEEVIFYGIKGTVRRKYITISNAHLTAPLWLRSNSVPFAVLWPQQTLAYETDADIGVFDPNSGAGTITFYVGEFFYTLALPTFEQ